MADDQQGLFDLADDAPPAPRRGRVDFLAGMLAVWVLDGSSTATQKERFREFARETLTRAEALA